jgi:hypothetical protein
VAADFFTIEAWERRGLQRLIALFLMELPTRKVEIAGIASSPNGLSMNQIGRNLTDVVDGILKGKRYLIHDRDPLFTTEFLQTLADCGVASVKLPPGGLSIDRANRDSCSLYLSSITRTTLRPLGTDRSIFRTLRDRQWLLSARKSVDTPEFTIGKGGYPVFPAGRDGLAGASGHYRWVRFNVSMQEIVKTLSFHSGRPVIDATQLTGKYDVDLRWWTNVSWLLERSGHQDETYPTS